MLPRPDTPRKAARIFEHNTFYPEPIERYCIDLCSDYTQGALEKVRNSDWRVETYQNVWGLFAGPFVVPILIAGSPHHLALLRDLHAIDRLLYSNQEGENITRVKVYIRLSHKKQTSLRVGWDDPESGNPVENEIGHQI